MLESLQLFDSICNNSWFLNTSIILFLNKTDLFREKLPRSPLSKLFPDYTGGSDFDNAAQFIASQFKALNRSPDKKTIYPHLTNATDTENIRYVWRAINDILIHTNLRQVGLL